MFHGLRRFRLRDLAKVSMEGLMVAAGQNLKRLLSQPGARRWQRRLLVASSYQVARNYCVPSPHNNSAPLPRTN